VTVVLKDNGGTANGGQDASSPQTFIITVTAPAGPANVAVLVPSVIGDLSALTNDISEVSLPTVPSLTWRIYQRAGANFDAVSRSQLVVWYDPDGAQPVTENEVSFLQQLYTNGMPLLFAGARVGSAAAGLSPGAQATWQELVHLTATGQSTSGPVIPQNQANPVINGAYGLLEVFNIDSPLDQATVTPDADSLAQVNGSDIIVAYPSVYGSNPEAVPTVTQLFPVELLGDTNSVVMRKGVFQNAICWMLRCGACSAVYPTFSYQLDSLSPQTGVPLTLSLSLGNSGECDAVSFLAQVQLSAGLTFVSATSDFGRVTQTNQIVSLSSARIRARTIIHLAITVVPQAPGWFTNEVLIETASSTPQTRTAAFEVQGVALPQWKIVRSAPGMILLILSNAESGRSYTVQRAILEPDNSDYLWSNLTNLSFSPPVFQLLDQICTNGAALYRLIAQ